MKRKMWLCGSLILALFSGCSSNSSYVKGGQIRKSFDQEAIKSTYIETIGIGAADSTLNNTTQRRATSRDAAIVQAQYEMLSIVKGIQVEGGITVEKALETASHLETTVKDTIRVAQLIKTEWN